MQLLEPLVLAWHVSIFPELEDVDGRNCAIPGGMDAGGFDSRTEIPTGARRERVVME